MRGNVPSLNVVVAAAKFILLGNQLSSAGTRAGARHSPEESRVGQQPRALLPALGRGLPLACLRHSPGHPPVCVCLACSWCSAPSGPCPGCSSCTRSHNCSFPRSPPQTTHGDGMTAGRCSPCRALKGHSPVLVWSPCCKPAPGQTLNSWVTPPSEAFPFIWM